MPNDHVLHCCAILRSPKTSHAHQSNTWPSPVKYVLLLNLNFNFHLLASTGLDSAEYFDVRTGQWKTVSNMSTRRSSVGVGVVGGEFHYVVIC